MTEDPIKLFATRGERYPQPTEADIAQGTARSALAAIPFVGGSITEILSLVLAPAVTRRRDVWFKDLADALDQLESKVDGFKVENLAENEAFVSATIQATRIALGTHRSEKREYLRNALLNIATGKCPDEEWQQIYLNAIEAFSASHVRVLNALWQGNSKLVKKGLWNPTNAVLSRIRNYGQAIAALVPEVQGKDGFLQYILSDLRNRGFATSTRLDDVFPQGMPITNAGIQFLRFVLDPQETQ